MRRKYMAFEPKLEIELTVNGKPVEMNEFVQKITANVLLGIVNSLHLDNAPKTAVFNLKIN
jgi:hypothetical protein